jgi:hypothetical protein
MTQFPDFTIFEFPLKFVIKFVSAKEHAKDL